MATCAIVKAESRSTMLRARVQAPVAGYYYDANNVSHAYVRARDSSFTTFDAPGAGKGLGQGTFPYSNNPKGAVTGNYIDASDVSHGFVWVP
jgi:hypothetical protein